MHAAVLPDQPASPNLGYVVDDAVYHPGDALTLPDVAIDTVLVPLQASWLKTSEAAEFVRAVAAERAIGIHDAQVNERALTSQPEPLARRVWRRRLSLARARNHRLTDPAQPPPHHRMAVPALADNDAAADGCAGQYGVKRG